MKTLFLATAAALSLSMGVAYAGDGDVPQANTLFTELPGVIAQAPVQNPSVATAQNGAATHIYGTHLRSQGIWLFPPNQAGGGN